MKTKWMLVCAALALASLSTGASARGGIDIGIYFTAPAPPPVYYSAPPVYYAPPPVYYSAPRAYYAPPRVYYAPAPVYYGPRWDHRGHGHRHGHRQGHRH